jgi:hypothetical protein
VDNYFLHISLFASWQCAVPAHGPATIGGGSRKDFNDMRRQARPVEYGSPGRRFQR